MISFPVRHLPGAGALAPGFDIFVSDPLHHYMETGVLKGITERAERALQDAHEGLTESRSHIAVEPSRPVMPVALRMSGIVATASVEQRGSFGGEGGPMKLVAAERARPSRHLS
jgi:hypothetical protein